MNRTSTLGAPIASDLVRDRLTGDLSLNGGTACQESDKNSKREKGGDPADVDSLVMSISHIHPYFNFAPIGQKK
jgi:hypothetical protein